MAKRKSVLQKISLISAVVSFVLMIISAVILVIRLKTVGSNDPVTASFLASTFFFLCVGVVFGVMGKADLPSFKVNNSEDEK